MRHFYIILVLFFWYSNNAQTFWTETFNNACNSNCLANGSNTGNGAWSVVSLAGDANPGIGDLPNQWYVSCAENGHTAGVCGTGCVALSAINTLASLHLGSTSIGDAGAAYDAGGVCGFLWCTNTHKRAQSPLISTAGKTNITLSFTYIEFGQGTFDDMYAVQYSTNGGTTWVTLSNPAKTPCCGGACNGTRQGQWTTYTSATLPVAAENIANFRIAFVWINNDDGLGTDPSFAVDNITLSTPVLPIELIDFSYESLQNTTLLKWESITESNSDYFEVLKSEDGFSFNSIGTVKAAGNSNKSKKYTFPDTEKSNSTIYYKLRMVDLDNTFKYSVTLAINGLQTPHQEPPYFINQNHEIEINADVILTDRLESLILYNTEGKQVGNFELRNYFSDGKIRIPVGKFPFGIYMAQLNGSSSTKTYKIFIPQ